jgi:O-antigen/teichoic acid export membrane protein
MASRAVTDVLLLMAGRAGLLGASAASLHLSTHLLGPVEIGRMQVVLAVIGLVALLQAGTGQFLQRHAAAWLVEGSLADNLRRYAAWLALAAGCSAALALLLPPPWLPMPRGWLALLLGGQLLVATLQQALLHLLNLVSLRRAYVLLGNAVAWGGLALASAGTAGYGGLAVHWLLGLLAAQALALLPAAWLLAPQLRARPRLPPSAPPFASGPVQRFASPVAIASTLYWVQRSLPLPWLAQADGLGTLGQFSVGFSLGMLAMLAFDTLFREVYGPRYDHAIATAYHAERVHAWEQYAAALLPAMAAAALCLVAAAPALLTALASPAFEGSARYIAWGAVCQVLLSCQGLVQLKAACIQDNRRLVLPQAAGALATLAALAPGWPLPAAEQAALALLIGPALTMLLSAWRLRERHAGRWPWKRLAWASATAAPVLGTALLPASLLVLGLLACFGVLQQWLLARSWLTTMEAA